MTEPIVTKRADWLEEKHRPEHGWHHWVLVDSDVGRPHDVNGVYHMQVAVEKYDTTVPVNKNLTGENIFLGIFKDGVIVGHIPFTEETFTEFVAALVKTQQPQEV